MFTFDNNNLKSRQQAAERLPQHQMAKTATSKFLSQEAGLLVHQNSRPKTPSDPTGQIASEGVIPFRPKTNHAFGSAQPHVDIYTRSSLYASQQCPHCLRNFSSKAAERHISVCKQTEHKAPAIHQKQIFKDAAISGYRVKSPIVGKTTSTLPAKQIPNKL